MPSELKKKINCFNGTLLTTKACSYTLSSLGGGVSTNRRFVIFNKVLNWLFVALTGLTFTVRKLLCMIMCTQRHVFESSPSRLSFESLRVCGNNQDDER